MVTQDARFSVLVLNQEVRSLILSLLRKNEQFSVGIADLDELLNPAKKNQDSIILIDSEAVLTYGAAVISKLKMSCPQCRLILLCSRVHRSLVKHVMELGAYGCIIEPYPEWEFATMVRPILSGQKIDKKIDKGIKASKAKRQGRKPQAN
ncbi:MAG: hypothetical protein ABSG91_09295 [Syntrophobacteraceae bacterium]|jgi:DNA-binding NarL/FixJ family response regulator